MKHLLSEYLKSGSIELCLTTNDLRVVSNLINIVEQKINKRDLYKEKVDNERLLDSNEKELVLDGHQQYTIALRRVSKSLKKTYSLIDEIAHKGEVFITKKGEVFITKEV